MPGWQVQFSLLGFMTIEAYARLLIPISYRIIVGMGLMAFGTGKVFFLMHTAIPVNPG
jgi:hypothetical protein